MKTINLIPGVPILALVVGWSASGIGLIAGAARAGEAKAGGGIPNPGMVDPVRVALETAPASVLVAPEWWWLESGSSSDLVIADNHITDCRGTAIEVVARGGTGALAPSGAHKNIAIRNNTILNAPLPTIYVTSTDKLVISGNRFKPLDLSLSRWNWGQNKPTAIVTEACTHAEVQPEGSNTP